MLGRRIRNLVAAAVLAVAASGSVFAHEGHDHGAPANPIPTTTAPRGEASSQDFEVVAVARGETLELSLDEFATNAPVSGATVEIDTPSGLLKAAEHGEGTYTVAAPFLSKPGKYDLAITVTAADKVDLLATTLNVPSSEPAALATAAKTQGGFGGLSLAVVAAVVGFLAGVLLMSRKRAAAVSGLFLAVAFGLTGTRVLASEQAEAALMTSEPKPHAQLSVPRDVAQRLPDGSVFVGKATQRLLAIRTTLTADGTHERSVELPGRVIPDPNASGLVQAAVGGRLLPPEGGFKPLGTAVKAGDILAYVRPPLPSADATVQAQQARELDQQISIVDRKVKRLTSLKDVIARADLEDAILELKGLRERRANLDRVNRDPEPLYAPVDGVLAQANAVAGQMAEPSSVIFQIVDPGKLWVEALAFEPEAIVGAGTAQLGDGRRISLSYLGTGLADRNQAVPVHFSIDGDTRGLRSGQFLTVYATTAVTRHGLALPRASVMRAMNGQAVVYEHVGAERFIAREVRTEPIDGESVLVVSGLEPGKRIVTQGAELLDQIR